MAGFVTVLTVILLSGIYLAIGATVFGPKTEVREACSSIAGKSFPAVTAIVEQYDEMDFMGTDSVIGFRSARFLADGSASAMHN